MPISRQLAAIMFTDIVGYTALMGNDEKKAFELLKKNRELQRPLIEKNNGRWIKELGDGVLASFNTVSDAVNAAVKIQEACNLSKEFLLRIGIHQGEVVFEQDDIFGDAVNIASRIQAIATPGGIYVSESIHNNVYNKQDITTQFVKQEILKNVKEPIKIYKVLLNSITSAEKRNDRMNLVPENSIAVLPFTNMSSDPEQEYFSDGISEEIINTLAQLPNLKVAGRTSSFTFKGKNEDLRSIGDKLNVSNVLEGSVRSFGNRIRITAQLIDVHNGYHLWSEKYDRILNDVFEVQDEIASAIVDKLQITLSGKLPGLKTREQTQNVEAYQHYLKGRALVYKRGKYLFEAIPLFQKALEIDPEYALAYAGLADTYTITSYYGLSEPEETWPKAIENAKKALLFGPDLAESHNCNAAISMMHDWDWEKSKKQYVKALELNPGYEQARIWYGLFYHQMVFLNHDEAIAIIRQTLETNPMSYYSNTVLGVSLAIVGKYKEGLENSLLGVKLDPQSYLAHFCLGSVYYFAGQFEDAVDTFDRALAMSNRHAWSLGMLLIVYHDWGKADKTNEIYEEIRTRSEIQYVQPTILAMINAALGRNEEALMYANKACNEHDSFMIFYGRCWPACKALYAIPGYNEVLKKMHLTD